MAPSDSNPLHTDSKVKPWSAEHALTGAFACALIAQQFPELKPIAAQYMGSGWDNTVFLINDTWVFRFPRREVAVELLDHEQITLNALQGFSLSYPHPLFLGQPGTVEGTPYPWPFVGYTQVMGTTACRARVSDEQRKQWVAPLARTLKHLHGHPIPHALPADLLKRSDLKHRLPWFKEQWQQAKAAAQQNNQHLPETSVQKLLQELKELAAKKERGPAPQHLLHGDLYIRHLIVNTAHELTGIIDWGDTHAGDISTDLAIVYSSLPPALHPQFWQVYGEVSHDTQRKAQFRALYSCLYIYRYGLDIQDPDLVREGWQGVQWIASLFP